MSNYNGKYPIVCEHPIFKKSCPIGKAPYFFSATENECCVACKVKSCSERCEEIQTQNGTIESMCKARCMKRVGFGDEL